VTLRLILGTLLLGLLWEAAYGVYLGCTAAGVAPILAPIIDVTPASIIDVTPASIIDVTPASIIDVTPASIIDVTPAPIIDVTPASIIDVTPAPIIDVIPAPIIDVTDVHFSQAQASEVMYAVWILSVCLQIVIRGFL